MQTYLFLLLFLLLLFFLPSLPRTYLKGDGGRKKLALTVTSLTYSEQRNEDDEKENEEKTGE